MVFNSIHSMVSHKRHYCKLRFTCKCESEVNVMDSSQRATHRFHSRIHHYVYVKFLSLYTCKCESEVNVTNALSLYHAYYCHCTPTFQSKVKFIPASWCALKSTTMMDPEQIFRIFKISDIIHSKVLNIIHPEYPILHI